MSRWPKPTSTASRMRPRGGTCRRIASVASFFVSRIDTKVDKAIDEAASRRWRQGSACGIARQDRDRQRQARLSALQAHVLRAALGGAGKRKGARPQRLLWASTGTKNKAYSDALYVDTLIGRGYGQHHAAGDHGRVPRSRPSAKHDRRGRSGDADAQFGNAARVRYFARRDHSGVGGRRRAACSPDAADKLYGALADKRAKISAAKF